jgi:hypothetical protein
VRWKLDDGSGSTAADASGNGNAAALNNTTWQTSGCKLGACAQFSGTGGAGGSNLTLPTGLATAGAGITYAAWIKPDVNGTGTYQSLFNSPYSSCCTTRLLIDPSLHPFWDAGQSSDETLTGYTFTLGQWMHVVWTVQTGGAATLYVNGAQVAQTTTGVPGAGLFPDMSNVDVAAADSFQWPFKGLFNDVLVYNRVLSTGEISAVYNSYSNQYQSAACTTTTDRACSSCAAIANCVAEMCTTSSDQTCATCATSYYVNGGGTCSACSGACSSGQYQSAACSTNLDRVCSSCTAIANCAAETCTTNSDQTCTSCNSGYVLSGNSCVPSFNFTVLSTKPVTYSGFNYLVVQVSLASTTSAGATWCNDYQQLCASFGRVPVGCGPPYDPGTTGYQECGSIYGANGVNDSLGCNPSGGVYSAAQMAGFAGATQSNSFGFHYCGSGGSNCSKTWCSGSYCNSSLSYYDASQAVGYTLCL